MHQKTSVRSAQRTMGVFSSQQAAEQAVQYISDLYAGDQTRFALIEPNDPLIEDKLKNEYSVMGQGAISIHIWSVVLSLLAGGIFWGVMYSMGYPAFVHEIGISLMGSLCVFLLVGVVIGVLFAYTPGRNKVIIPVREATAKGNWVIVAYPNSKNETQATIDYFSKAKNA